MQIGNVIKDVLNLAGFTANRTPSKSTVLNVNMERHTLSQTQLNAVIDKQNLCTSNKNSKQILSHIHVTKSDRAVTKLKCNQILEEYHISLKF